MAFRSQSLLQFDELKELVASYAGSRAALEQLVDLEVSTDRDALHAALAETNEAIAYLNESSDAQAGRGAPVRLKFNDVHDVRPSVGILRVEGARLDGRALLDLFQVLEVAGEHRSLLLGVRERFPKLARRAGAMTDLRWLAKRFGRVFLPDGSLADDASPALHRLRRDIEKQQRAIQQSLEHFLRAHKDDGTLQEDFVTVRDGRFVVPVVAGQKGRVTGIIHGTSGSGHTLFMEPLETIEQNNALVRLREDEQREVERILAEITDALREHAVEITGTLEMLVQLDVVFAKASFAADYAATVPRFSVDGARRMVVKEARHPLLEKVLRHQRKEIVPVSFALDEGNRCLLISGPNTGGKTVTLKTAGLLALMAQAALPVPASEAEFPIFDDILADIGDTQSIAESLSSFSGHLLHVKEMMDRATPDSLVLLDELGRATDPEEGGALGVAILDRFRQSGAFCLASTHLLPLKLYGAQTPGVVNASMGFDDATLQPTYQLQVGLPGKSAGIDIATRLQLPADVIRHAREVLPKLEADFQSLLVALQKQLEEATARTRQLELAQLDVTRLREGVER
jgi:DNA mismatch repair protein MutS2